MNRAASAASRTVVTGPGHAPAAWAPTIAAAPLVPVDSLVPQPGARLVVVGAHPDDETLGAGRLIADWARQVGPVVAATATAGEACVEHVGVRVPGLAARRAEEWQAAVAALGARALEPWGLPDGGLAAEVDHLATRLVGLLGPDDVLLAPWRHDPHPDHASLGAAAALAADRTRAHLVEYPVWMTYWALPSVLANRGFELLRVATSDAAGTVRERALAEYVSQHEPLRADLTPVVPPEMLAHHAAQLALRPREVTRG